MKKIFLFLFLFLLFATTMAFAASSPISTQNISALVEDAARIDSKIKESQIENEKYSGGLIKSQIESRIAVLKLTQSIIEQKLQAVKTGAKMKIEAPATQANLEEVGKLEKELLDIDSNIARSQENADKYSGGLIRVQMLSTIATMEGTRALLQQRMLTSKYGLGIPPRVGGDTSSIVSSRSVQKTKTVSLAETIITVEILNKRFQEKKYGHAIYFDLSFAASGLDKPARAIKGILLINDLFGEKIMGIKWNLDKSFAPASIQVETGVGFDYNQFMNEHQRIKNSDISNIKVAFQVDSILYEDGTRKDF